MIHSDQAVDHPEAPAEPDVTSGLPETVLDLPGFRVLDAAEYGGELEVLVETATTIVMCRRCGRRASSHARHEHRPARPYRCGRRRAPGHRMGDGHAGGRRGRHAVDRRPAMAG